MQLHRFQWGGPGQGYEWPENNHGLTVDSRGNVWYGDSGWGYLGKLDPRTGTVMEYPAPNYRPARADGRLHTETQMHFHAQQAAFVRVPPLTDPALLGRFRRHS